jgi:tetratricopeptide (TPR) repeat protein
VRLKFLLNADIPISDPPDEVTVKRVETSDLAPFVSPRLVYRKNSESCFSYLDNGVLDSSFLAFIPGKTRPRLEGLCLIELEDSSPVVVSLSGTPEVKLALLSRALGSLKPHYSQVFASDHGEFEFLKAAGFRTLGTEASSTPGKLELDQDYLQAIEARRQRIEVAKIYLKMGQRDKAMEYFKAAFSTPKALPEPEVEGQACSQEIAWALLNQGRFEEAMEAFGEDSSDPPERVQFQLKFARGNRKLFWLDLKGWTVQKPCLGKTLGPKEMAYTTPLLFDLFGENESWFQSLHSQIVADCCVGLRCGCQASNNQNLRTTDHMQFRM